MSYGTFTQGLKANDEALIQLEYEDMLRERKVEMAQRAAQRVEIEGPLTGSFMEMDALNIEMDAPNIEGEADVSIPEATTSEVVTTPAVEAEATEPAPAVDFATIIRSLPKEPDPTLYSRIKD